MLDKSKTAGNCIFPLANLYFELSVDFVPDENIGKNLEGMYIGPGQSQIKILSEKSFRYYLIYNPNMG